MVSFQFVSHSKRTHLGWHIHRVFQGDFLTGLDCLCKVHDALVQIGHLRTEQAGWTLL